MRESRSIIMLPHIIERYCPTHKNVTLSVISGLNDSSLSMPQINRLDMYLGPYMKFPGDFVSERISRDYLYFIISDKLLRATLGSAADNFLEDNRYGISVSDASIFPVAMPPINTSLRNGMELSYQKNGVRPNLVLESTSEVLYKHLHDGYFPEEMHYFPSLGMGELTYYGMAYKKNQSSYAEEFIQCSRETLNEVTEEIDIFLLKRS